MRVCPTACPFFRDFFLFFYRHPTKLPSTRSSEWSLFFYTAKKITKTAYKYLTYARVSYIIISLLSLFLLNFSFIINKLYPRLTKPSKKFTNTKLFLLKNRRLGDCYEFRKKNQTNAKPKRIDARRACRSLRTDERLYFSA